MDSYNKKTVYNFIPVFALLRVCWQEQNVHYGRSALSAGAIVHGKFLTDKYFTYESYLNFNVLAHINATPTVSYAEQLRTTNLIIYTLPDWWWYKWQGKFEWRWYVPLQSSRIEHARLYIEKHGVVAVKDSKDTIQLSIFVKRYGCIIKIKI